MSMWTFWRVPTGPPPPYFVVFVWLNLNQSKNIQRKTNSVLEAFISLLELSDSAGSTSSISTGARSTGASMNLKVPTQKSPSKSSKRSLREIGCQWSTLYILYVQIYKHKDVVSLRMSSSPRISAKILHQRLLPFVAAISSVFTRPFLSSPSSQPPEALKSAKVLGANSIANESTVRCEERVRSTRGINEFISDYIVYIMCIYISYHDYRYVSYSLSSLSFARKVHWFCSYANLDRSSFWVTLFGP